MIHATYQEKIFDGDFKGVQVFIFNYLFYGRVCIILQYFD